LGFRVLCLGFNFSTIYSLYSLPYTQHPEPSHLASSRKHCLREPVGDGVMLIHMDHRGTMVEQFRLAHLGVGDNDDEVTLEAESCGSAVKADITVAFRSFDGVGGEARAIVHVEHVNLLVGDDIRGRHQLFINGDTAFVIDIGFSDAGPVNFAFHHGSHVAAPRKYFICFLVGEPVCPLAGSPEGL